MPEKPIITSAVIERAKRGDSQAVSLIYQAYVGHIYRYVTYRVGSVQDAEDITGDVFIRMVEGLPAYEERGIPFEVWLYKIASARIADFYRKHGKQQQVELNENLKKDDVSPEQLLVNEEEVGDLKGALHQLNEDEQIVLIMRFFERKSHQEVAMVIEKSVSAVKSIQHRALVKLASLMGAEEKVRHYLRGRND